MNSSIIISLLIGAVATLVIVFGLRKQEKPQDRVTLPPLLGEEESQRVLEAIDRIREAKEAAEKLADEEREAALQQVHDMIDDESYELMEDPDALYAYLMLVGKEMRDE